MTAVLRGFPVATAARALLVTGAEMAQVAVAYEIYQHTKDPLSLGLLGLAQFLPVLLFAVPAGQVGDRFPRHATALIMLSGLTIAMFGILLIDRRDLTLVYGLMFVIGTLRAFLGPAWAALLASLIPAHSVARYSAINSMLFCIAAIAGPSIGGVLLAAISADFVYLVSAMLVGVAVLLTALVQAPRTEAGEKARLSFATALDGLRFVWGQPVLFSAIAMDFVAVFLGGITALLPIFAVDVLHVGAAGLGVLRAAPSVGAGVLGLWLTLRPLRRRTGLTLMVCVAIFGGATIVFGLSTSFPLSLAMLAVLGAADMVSVVVRSALLQVLVPSEWRGRVSAVNGVFIGASNELGEMESGVAARLIGPVAAVVAGGVGTVVVVVVVFLAVPALWRIDSLEDLPRPDG
ncbi:MAG: MFS transporter [Deltaproteobacteria bacterium]|nr:MFS transporter [Deltaproteobacteria bacterium]